MCIYCRYISYFIFIGQLTLEREDILSNLTSINLIYELQDNQFVEMKIHISCILY